MGKAETFWTPKRLIELRVKSRTMTADELITYFRRPLEEIYQAQRFEQNKRLLKAHTRIEIIDGKRVTVTTFGATYAIGAKSASVHSAMHLLF